MTIVPYIFSGEEKEQIRAWLKAGHYRECPFKDSYCFQWRGRRRHPGCLFIKKLIGDPYYEYHTCPCNLGHTEDVVAIATGILGGE